MQILGQPMEQTHCIMDKWGYTGSACIPMALDDALQSRGLPQAGQTVVSVPAVAGLRWPLRCGRWG